MKTASPISSASLFVGLILLASSVVKGENQSKVREYRPLLAKAVRMEVAAPSVGTTKGAVKTRQGWAAFDAGRWEEAMDFFISALEADASDASAAEGLTMSVYRSGDRSSAAELGEEFSEVMPWIRGMLAETLRADVKEQIAEGKLGAAQRLVAALPYGDGVYDRVRQIVNEAEAEQAASAKHTVAQTVVR